MSPSRDKRVALECPNLDHLIEVLADDGYTVVGPRVADGAIIYGEISSVADMPEGWTDSQEPGSYRLEKREDKALFGYAVGPHSWKRYLFPANLKLWSASRDDDGTLSISNDQAEIPRYAFIGVRGCELAAMRVQDRVFGSDRYGDADYRARRAAAFVVAVDCGTSADTCFCVSMGTGPSVDSGYDIALTELLDTDTPRYVADAGSDDGAAMLARLESSAAPEADVAAAEAVVEKTAAGMKRQLDTAGIKEILYAGRNASTWDDVASRCLSCTNCTMVCPTCFCHSVTETSDLQMSEFEHTREWDSCFSMEFTFAAGGVVRDTTSSRYRQWMTHKLGSWIDQFGTSGCVGCGRCIAWCPVGIDITNEASVLRNEIEGIESEESQQ